MSEAEVLEPVPVTKDPALVNGDSAPELPPPTPELQNGINKPVMDVGNGVGDEHEMENENVTDNAETPVNGDCNGQGEISDNDDLMGDELPPPPEVIPELPPPPPVSDSQEQDLLTSDNIEQEPNVEVKSPGEVVVGENQIDEESEVPVDETVETNVVDDVSEEELVSDGGLKEEVDVEIQNNQENEVVEQAEGQLVDLTETEQVQEGPVEVVETPVPTGEMLVDINVDETPVSADTVVEAETEQEEESVPESEPVPEPEPVVETVPIIITEAEPVSEQEPEPVVEAVEPVQEPAGIVEEPANTVPEPVQEEPVESVPEPAGIVEEPTKSVPEPAQAEPVESVPEPVQEPVELVSEQVPENVPEQEQATVEENEPVVDRPQIGYAEPDIIVDNKPAEEELEEVDVPPPPPPPLIDETPPPPPPLDESVQLKRVSGGSTPTKQSPCKELESPVLENAPAEVLAAISEPEPVQEPEPEQPPSAVAEEKPKPEPIVVNPPQADQGPEELSAPGSPTSVSEPALSEGGQSDTGAISSPQVSQKINKKNFKNKIKFGVDLVEAALKQLHFMISVNKHPTVYEEWLFQKAIRRYEAFWLPLAAEHKKESLAAPIDIEWLWHCHMLAPLTYETDCKNLVGLVVEHKLMSEKDRTKSLEKSRKYWTAKYPSEPFEIELVYREKVVEEPVAEEEAAPGGAEAVEGNKDESSTQDAAKAKETPDEGTPAPEEQPAPAAPEEGQTQEGSEVAAPDTQQEAPAEPPTEAEPQTTEPAQEPAPAPVPAPVPAPEPIPEPAQPVVPEEGYERRTSYDIWSAISRQRVFAYQVSLPHFHDKLYLKTAVKRYQKFLFLKHQNPNEIIVPCYDIDLIWHAHQLHPSVYKHDITKVLGQMLHHDDSVNDRTAGSKLARADQKTRDIWKTLFDDTFVTFGGMYRGDPPILCERMSQIEHEETYGFSTKKATINLDKVQVEGLPEEVNKYNVKLVYGASEKDGPVIKQFKGNKKKIEFENVKKGLAHFVFDTKEYDRIKFNMTQQIGFACTGHNEELGEQVFNLMPVVESIPMNKSDPSAVSDEVTIDIDEEHKLKALFSATIEPPKQGPTMLFLKNGNYETRFCIMPEQIVQMWGPIPLPRLPTGRDNHCIVASHKFVNHTGEVTFTCRLIHSLPLLMSAVQVFFQNKMAAVGHLIGSDQIPLPSQLSDSKKVFSLNPADGQRGILIKNRTGDWGMVRGQWTGFKKHQPSVAATKGKKAKKEVPWCPGTLSISFYKCMTGTWQHLNLPYLQDSYKFTIQDANVDLKTGVIEINSDSNEVAENLSLAFSVALLHVLCQPRYTPPPPPEPIPVMPEVVVAPPAEPKAEEKPKEEETPAVQGQEGEGEAAADAAAPTPAPEAQPTEPPPVAPKTPKSPAKSEPATPSKKVKEVMPIPTFDLSMIVAAGYNVDTATNDNIKKQYGVNACAGCSSGSMDVGIGLLGNQVAEVEVAEAVENVEVAGNNTAADVTEAADGGEMEAHDGMDMDGMDMDAMGDVGDAGAAACGGF